MARVFGSRKRQFGDRGERLAERYLRRKGFRIVARNVIAARYGELDLVTVHRGMLVFVEVKTRRSSAFGTPEEAISPAKREKLARAIQWYLQRKSACHVRHRLDLIAIEWGESPPLIRHLEAI